MTQTEDQTRDKPLPPDVPRDFEPELSEADYAKFYGEGWYHVNGEWPWLNRATDRVNDWFVVAYNAVAGIFSKVRVVRLTSYLGFSVQQMLDADGKVCLTGVIWYPKGWRQLGYLYPHIRWFGRRV